MHCISSKSHIVNMPAAEPLRAFLAPQSTERQFVSPRGPSVANVAMALLLPTSQSFSIPLPVPVRIWAPPAPVFQFTERHFTSFQTPCILPAQRLARKSQSRIIPSIDPDTAYLASSLIWMSETQTMCPCIGTLVRVSSSQSITPPSVEPLIATPALQATSKLSAGPWWPPWSARMHDPVLRSHIASVPFESPPSVRRRDQSVEPQ
mmetsp:Transcript_46287/g.99105  ORF Transcript_46287/g.99105 Transcript_46287/m.99105 type:complete len:206 (-) Transcript_46287:485-1102(-)